MSAPKFKDTIATHNRAQFAVKALSEVLSANRRGIGNLPLKRGRLKEASDAYKHAILLDNSSRSLEGDILPFAAFRFN